MQEAAQGVLKKQHQFFVALLGLFDGVVITLACLGAWALRRMWVEGFFPGQVWESWVKGPLFVFVVPVVLIVMWGVGIYRPRRDRSMWGEQWSIFKASAASMMAVIVLLWAVGNDAVVRGPGGPSVGPLSPMRGTVGGHLLEGGRVQLLTLAVLLPIGLGLQRLALRGVLRELRRRGKNLRHVAIIGCGRLGQICCRTIERNKWTGIHVNYFISHHAETRRTQCLDRDVVGGLDELEETLRERPVDAVYLAIPNERAAVVPQVLQRLDRFTVDVRIVPDMNPRFVPQNMVVNELDGMPILSYRENPSQGVGGFTKRAVDIAGALVGLAIFGVPILIIAAVIRMTSPGPVIFKQRRMSLGNRTFKIYKFRTMYHVKDEAGLDRSGWSNLKDEWTQRNDPRITPIGRWLRKTSLDELPQLLNVLKGQMSLVGPRPERPELVARFREDWRGYMIRQHVKAGMTGWAQVNGLRGDTSLRKRLQYDLFYVRHWSLGFDLRILWLTMFRGFVHHNAH